MLSKFCRILFLIITGCNLLVHGNPVSAQESQELVIVSIPWQTKEQLNTMYAPLLDLLKRSLQKEVRLIIAEQYQEAGDYLYHHTADIGILGAASYVEAKEKYPEITYLATCKQPTAFYNSLIIAHKSSGIHTLSDLVGKSFAYTEKDSTSGYIYPRMMLQDAGLDPDAIFSATYFLNKHDKIYTAVAKQAVDAGGVSITPRQKAIEEHGNVYNIISTSAPIPRNAVVAGPRLSGKELSDIRAILEQAENDPKFAADEGILKGFLIKDDHFYDIIRKARKLQ